MPSWILISIYSVFVSFRGLDQCNLPTQGLIKVLGRWLSYQKECDVIRKSLHLRCDELDIVSFSYAHIGVLSYLLQQ